MSRPPIKTIADRVLELLSRSDTEPIFAKFCQELRLLDSPICKQTITEGVVDYVLPELGVSICSTDTTLLSASFHVQPTQFEDITTFPYCNELPFGLTADYKINDVHAVLGPPHKTNSPCGLWAHEYYNSESYSLEPWDLILWYTRPDEQLSTLIVYRHQVQPET